MKVILRAQTIFFFLVSNVLLSDLVLHVQFFRIAVNGGQLRVPQAGSQVPIR